MAQEGLERGIEAGASAVAAPRVPHPAPGLEVGPPRDREGRSVVSLPSGRFFEVSPQTALLLGLVDGERDVATLAALLSERASPPIDAQTLRELIDRSLVPKGLVHWGEPPAETGPPRSSLLVRLPIVPARTVNAAAGALAPLFRPRVAAIAGALTLGAHAWFYLSGPRLGLERDWFHAGEWLPPVLLYQLSGFAHELGHAAALRHQGERAGAMGVGIYRFFVVYFTDVSRAWRLPRLSRAVVDAGGLYAQVLFAGALIALYAWTRHAAPARAVVLVDLSLIANLNPFLRMDGYWLAADLTETSNLRGRSLDVARALLSRRGAGEVRVPRFLLIYALLSLVYFPALVLWLVLGVMPRVVHQMVLAWRALGAGGGPMAMAGPALFLVLGAALTIGIALFTWTGARTIAGALTRRTRASAEREGRPAG